MSTLACDTTYKDTENLITYTCWKFHKSHGGDFEELKAEANKLFLKAYSNFDYTKSSFGTWLYYIIWRGLLSWSAKESRQTQYYKNTVDVDVPDKTSNWSLSDFMEELTSDARIVAMLAIDTPKEIIDIVEAKGGEIRNIRSTIRQYLVTMGWGSKRITESFNEIRTCLRG